MVEIYSYPGHTHVKHAMQKDVNQFATKLKEFVMEHGDGYGQPVTFSVSGAKNDAKMSIGWGDNENHLRELVSADHQELYAAFRYFETCCRNYEQGPLNLFFIPSEVVPNDLEDGYYCLVVTDTLEKNEKGLLSIIWREEVNHADYSDVSDPSVEVGSDTKATEATGGSEAASYRPPSASLNEDPDSRVRPPQPNDATANEFEAATPAPDLVSRRDDESTNPSLDSIGGAGEQDGIDRTARTASSESIMDAPLAPDESVNSGVTDA